MKQITSRRSFLRSASQVAVAIPLSALLSSHSLAAGNELDPNDAQAKALQYKHQTEMAGSQCDGCQLYVVGDIEGWGNCAIFPGKLVAAKGWCISWVKKAG